MAGLVAAHASAGLAPMVPSLVVAAHAVFAAAGVALIRIDVVALRLPDGIVLPTALALTLLFAAAGVAAGDLAPAGRAAAGALTLFAAHAALRRASPGSLGGGDVKLALPVGVVLAWHGWDTLAAGSVAAWACTAAWALLLVSKGRAASGTRIPHGPGMILGAWTALLVT